MGWVSVAHSEAVAGVTAEGHERISCLLTGQVIVIDGAAWAVPCQERATRTARKIGMNVPRSDCITRLSVLQDASNDLLAQLAALRCTPCRGAIRLCIKLL